MFTIYDNDYRSIGYTSRTVFKKIKSYYKQLKLYKETHGHSVEFNGLEFLVCPLILDDYYNVQINECNMKIVEDNNVDEDCIYLNEVENFEIRDSIIEYPIINHKNNNNTTCYQEIKLYNSIIDTLVINDSKKDLILCNDSIIRNLVVFESNVMLDIDVGGSNQIKNLYTKKSIIEDFSDVSSISYKSEDYNLSIDNIYSVESLYLKNNYSSNNLRRGILEHREYDNKNNSGIAPYTYYKGDLNNCDNDLCFNMKSMMNTIRMYKEGAEAGYDTRY